jgi:hypothetical protein
MPEIQWLDLLPQLRQHLFDRAKEWQIPMQDLFALEEWRRHSPDVPNGPWYKDFGSFKALRRRAVSQNLPPERAGCARSGSRVESQKHRCSPTRLCNYGRPTVTPRGGSAQSRQTRLPGLWRSRVMPAFPSPALIGSWRSCGACSNRRLEWGKIDRALPRVEMVPGENHRDRVLSRDEECRHLSGRQRGRERD